MKISKQGAAISGGVPDESQLRLVNQQSRREMTKEEVYVFSLRLCDDQVDRDGERFATASLPELGRLFIGKPGIVDHNWSAEKQTARIFDTEVVTETGGVSWLKAWAYIPREGREELIRDIESGIRREVSISCSMGKRRCSICGEAIGDCGHKVGESYDGRLCTAILEEPRDAYEFSFVAVPAQRESGVVKHWKGGDDMKLREYLEKSGNSAVLEEFHRLERLADYGRRQRETAEQEAVRLGLAAELGLDRQELRKMVQGMEPETLDKLVLTLRKQVQQRYPGTPQLERDRLETDEESTYLI